MLIYGNTPKDIGAMMWRGRYKLLSILCIIAVAVMLVGCGTKKADGQLNALDKFWDTLGGKKTDLIEKVK